MTVGLTRTVRPAVQWGVAMLSGMLADLMIVTGGRTALRCRLGPLRDTLRRGLREG